MERNKMIYPRLFFIIVLSLSGPGNAASFSENLAQAALERTEHQVSYDGAYRKLAYPNGDVANNKGVCTDLVIRSYRQVGLDLQQLVHDDMLQHFNLYPSKRIWGLSRPDSNIDHRRVPNLQTYFSRFGQSLAISNQAEDYKKGDIVTWMLPGNLPHIGLVVENSRKGVHGPLIVHNIGAGPQEEDMLFDYKITGHYRLSKVGKE